MRLGLRPLVHLTAALALGSLHLHGAYAQAQPMQAQPIPKISVTATGKAELAPDLAIISMTVRTEEKAARSAVTANNQLMARVLAALRESGIEDADMQTSGFSIAPQIRYPNNREANTAPQTVGYTVQNTLTIRVRDLTIVGEVLDQSVTLGVNRGGSIRFSHSNPSNAIKQARIQAVLQAREKAETLASAAGVSLGRILRLSEQSREPRAVSMIQAARSVSADAGSVPIASGENTYSVTVSIDWQIQQ